MDVAAIPERVAPRAEVLGGGITNRNYKARSTARASFSASAARTRSSSASTGKPSTRRRASRQSSGSAPRSSASSSPRDTSSHANLAGNHDLGEDEERELLEGYRGKTRPADLDALHLMHYMSDFREAMWGVVQQGISELEEDASEPLFDPKGERIRT